MCYPLSHLAGSGSITLIFPSNNLWWPMLNTQTMKELFSEQLHVHQHLHKDAFSVGPCLHSPFTNGSLVSFSNALQTPHNPLHLSATCQLCDRGQVYFVCLHRRHTISHYEHCTVFMCPLSLNGSCISPRLVLDRLVVGSVPRTCWENGSAS